MKKLISVFLIALFCTPMFAYEPANYTVSATTNAVAGASQVLDGVNIADTVDKVRVNKIVLSNSLQNIAQTVSFYDVVTSTSALTKVFEVELSTTNSSGVVDINFDTDLPLVFHDGLIVRKSSALSNVKVNIVYK